MRSSNQSEPGQRDKRLVQQLLSVLAALTLFMSGCAKTKPVEPSQMPEELPAVEFYLRDGTFVWFRQASLSKDEQFVTGIVRECRGKSCDTIRAEKQVAVQQIWRAELYPRDVTRARAIGASVGVAAAIGIGVGVGIAVSNMSTAPPPPSDAQWSCPLVYSHDGAGWVLDSGTYGGSIFAGHPRTDFDILEAATPREGRLDFRVETPRDETDFTDLLAVHAIDHPEGSRVVPEMDGGLAIFIDPSPPARATDLRGRDIREDIAARDEVYWKSDPSGRDPEVADHARDGILMEVERPEGADEARVWLSAMNTPWSVAMIDYLISQMGTEREEWARAMAADSTAREAFEHFMIREGMLRVFVETDQGWSERGYFWEPGPELRKDQALRIPIADVAGARLRIRLETAVGYWQIDSVLIDFVDEPNVTTARLELVSALTDAGDDVRDALDAAGGGEVRTRHGERLSLSYRVPESAASGVERTWLLQSSGYYIVHVEPDPDGGMTKLRPLLAQAGAASSLSLSMLNQRLFLEFLK